MGHPPFPRGATGPGIVVIQDLHKIADRNREPEVRRASSGAADLIVELIEARMSRRGFDAEYDVPRDDG